jgi:MFS transporter, DHA1 family, solute carrier family 18 (vesicular amine transporter), member 1/2
MRGPCVFGVIVIAVDLMGRLLLIERGEALVWGFDPVESVNSSLDGPPNLRSLMDSQYGTFSTETDFSSEGERQPLYASDSEEIDYADSILDRGADEVMGLRPQHDAISFSQIIKGLFMSSRAVAALMNSLVCG